MRGFNQSAYLADRVGEQLQIPVAYGLVKKIRNTKSQKKLNAAQRKRNLADAFRAEENIRGLTVLVIDDVYTTGSTVDAMAQCLKGAGAEQVYFITLCAGPVSYTHLADKASASGSCGQRAEGNPCQASGTGKKKRICPCSD